MSCVVRFRVALPLSTCALTQNRPHDLVNRCATSWSREPAVRAVQPGAGEWFDPGAPKDTRYPRPLNSLIAGWGFGFAHRAAAGGCTLAQSARMWVRSRSNALGHRTVRAILWRLGALWQSLRSGWTLRAPCV